MIRFYRGAAHIGPQYSLILALSCRYYWDKYRYLKIGIKWNNIEYYVQIRILTCRNPEPIISEDDNG